MIQLKHGMKVVNLNCQSLFDQNEFFVSRPFLILYYISYEFSLLYAHNSGHGGCFHASIRIKL